MARARPAPPATRTRPPLVRVLAVVVGLLAAAAAVTAYAGGAVADPSPAASAATASAPSAAGPADPDGTGRQVFLRDCAWCHGNDGTGTQNGPTLEKAGALTTDFYLRTGRMPLKDPGDRVERGPAAYSEDVIRALDSYVASLGDGPELFPTGSGDPLVGRRLFLGNCAACHSASGTGMVMTGGNWAPELYQTDHQAVGEAIRIGPGPMPPFTEKQLDQEEVDDIVAYVGTLGAEQARGGAPIEQYGPIMEGLLLWLVGLPLLVLVIRLLGKRAKS